MAKADQTAKSSFKYKPHSYKERDKLWFNKSFFRDAYSKYQESDKLSTGRFGPFTVVELVGKNALKLELPSHVKIYDVVNVVHTVPHRHQPQEISATVSPGPDPIPSQRGEEYEVERILNHSKRRTEFQFLTLMRGSPTHDSEWQPSKDFMDADGTINNAFLEYVKSRNILRDFWATDVVEDDNRAGVGIV